MVIRPDPDEFIAEVKKHLPPGFDFEVTARLRGAFTRAREVKSATALFRLAMAYGAVACRCAKPAPGQRRWGLPTWPIHRCLNGCAKRPHGSEISLQR